MCFYNGNIMFLGTGMMAIPWYFSIYLKYVNTVPSDTVYNSTAVENPAHCHSLPFLK